MEEKIGVRKEIDALGRLVIPQEIRDLFGLYGEVELVVTEAGVLVKSPCYILVKKENGVHFSSSRNKNIPLHDFCAGGCLFKAYQPP